MKRRFLTTMPALAAALVLAACGGEEGVYEGDAIDEGVEPVVEAPAVEAPTTVGYADWDVDRGGTLDANEFTTFARDRVYGTWAGASPGLDRDEWGAGVLGAWDADDDMRVTEAEWTANRAWFGDRDPGAFGDWDLNDDTFLDATELGQGFERTGAWGDWDRDASGMLEENEFGEGMFGLWDTNENQMIEENEWGAGYGAWGL